jgi:biopolymer transport protein ExbD
MAIRLKTGLKPMVSINAVSMTDMVMLLLIFFLLSSSFIIQPGIQVKLPKAATTEVQSERNIVVTLTAKGDLYLNQGKIAVNELAVQLLHEMARSDDRTIVVRADQDVNVQQLVQVMDIAKSVGADKFLIATQETDE